MGFIRRIWVNDLGKLQSLWPKPISIMEPGFRESSAGVLENPPCSWRIFPRKAKFQRWTFADLPRKASTIRWIIQSSSFMRRMLVMTCRCFCCCFPFIFPGEPGTSSTWDDFFRHLGVEPHQGWSKPNPVVFAAKVSSLILSFTAILENLQNHIAG